MKWFIKCIKNYVNFKGRARRSEYWYFALYSMIIMILAMLVDWFVFKTPIGVFYGVAALLLILPSLAVWMRRLHDTGRSGKLILWYYLSVIVWLILLAATGASFFLSAMQTNLSDNPMVSMPPVGFLVVYLIGAVGMLVWGVLFLVWACTAGTIGDNKYGPDPKALEQ